MGILWTHAINRAPCLRCREPVGHGVTFTGIIPAQDRDNVDAYLVCERCIMEAFTGVRRPYPPEAEALLRAPEPPPHPGLWAQLWRRLTHG